MTTSTDFLVDKNDLAMTETVRTELAALAEGQVLLGIEKFALTANNVTYAVFGEQMAYWNFFPAKEGWGRVPVWGFAKIIGSRHPEIAEGERLYGYLPISTHLIVEPGKVSDETFTDMAAHRQPMSSIYNSYARLSADPLHDEGLEDYRALFQPLFTTSFLIETFMRKENFFGAQSLLITSASSKTGMALAECAKADSPGIERIGLTSAGNIDYVESLGLYDRAIPYDAIGSLDADVPSVVVDFAGNGAALSEIHNRFADNLKYSCLVGATHWDARGLADDIAGPGPILFFAPDHGMAMAKELGPDGYMQAVGSAWTRFIGDAQNRIDVVRKDGASAVEQTWRALLSGEASARVGFVLGL